jgi:hypothetical protein
MTYTRRKLVTEDQLVSQYRVRYAQYQGAKALSRWEREQRAAEWAAAVGVLALIVVWCVGIVLAWAAMSGAQNAMRP